MNGYIQNDQIRSSRCNGCDSTPTLVVESNNPNLLLYGCRANKCRHILIRIKFSETSPTEFTPIPIAVRTPAAALQQIASAP